MSEPESQNESQPSPEPQSQNGAPEPESNSNHEPDPQPETEPEQPESQEQVQLEPESGSRPDPEVNSDADLKETAINSNDVVGTNSSPHPQLKKDEGSRTFTMRELLHGLKNDSEPEREDVSSPYRFSAEPFHFIG